MSANWASERWRNTSQLIHQQSKQQARQHEGNGQLPGHPSGQQQQQQEQQQEEDVNGCCTEDGYKAAVLVLASPSVSTMSPGQKSQDPTPTEHPVLTLLAAKPDAINTGTLQEYVEYQNKATDQAVPRTLTKFFTEYTNFLIVRHLRYNRSQYGPRHFRWNINETLDCLSKVAFLRYIHDVAITYTLLDKILPSTKELTADTDDFKPDMIFRAFGLLEIVGADNRKVTYRFREAWVEEYLVAHHLALLCLKKKMSGKDHVVSSGLKDCMRRLPDSGDIIRIMFGLLNIKPEENFEPQWEVMRCLLDETKLLPRMEPFQVTSLCVEIVYESQNAGDLTEHMDRFTMNQTINYSNARIPPHRLPYVVSAVGYIVRASPVVYGVHMSNIFLKDTTIAMLADPVNEISDNSLQVLNLSNNNLGTRGVKRLQRFLVKATLLTHLDLSSCSLGSMGIALLSEFFMCFPLQYLRLTDNQIGDAAIKHLSSNLKYIPTLEWLDLSENFISDKSAEHLGKALPSLPNLRSLDVRRNQISDDGAEAITKHLSQLNQVTQLMLSENKIGETGATRMARHVWKTSSLRYINLSLNNIPQTGVLSLRNAETSHGSLKIDVSPSVATVANSTSRLNGLHGDDGSGEAEFNRDKPLVMCSSVDLMAGTDSVKRRPKNKASPARDFRKSWHGMTGSIRHSFRRMEYN